MNFGYGEKVETLRAKLHRFMTDYIFPNEKVWHDHTVSEQRWQPVPIIEELKTQGTRSGPLEPVATEIAWRSARPTRIRALMRGHGTGALGAGSVQLLRSRHWQYGNFAELRYNAANRDVVRASARRQDPLRLSDDGAGCGFVRRHQHSDQHCKRDGADYVINGRKWWSSGAGDPRCKIYIVMGKTDPDNLKRHKQQSMILVPADTLGVKVLRHLPVFGFDDAPHGHMEIALENVRVPSRICCSERGADSRSRKVASVPAASTTACA